MEGVIRRKVIFLLGEKHNYLRGGKAGQLFTVQTSY